MLGVRGSQCCVLTCLLPFEKLIGEKLSRSDFNHYSTDWNGRDDIERTLSIEKLKPTGRKIELEKPIYFRGYDTDMGHRYDWSFPVLEIWEVKNKK